MLLIDPLLSARRQRTSNALTLAYCLALSIYGIAGLLEAEQCNEVGTDLSPGTDTRLARQLRMLFVRYVLVGRLDYHYDGRLDCMYVCMYVCRSGM